MSKRFHNAMSMSVALAFVAGVSWFQGEATGFGPVSAALAQGQGSGGQGSGGQGSGGQGGDNGQAGGAQNQEQEQNRNNEQNRNREQNRSRERNGDGEDGGGVGTMTKQQAQSLADHVCFYTDPGFSGDAFCGGEGAYSKNLSDAWNNKISSIEIVGTIVVAVCTEEDYTGFCADFTASASQLPANMDNAITSWRVK